MELCPEATGCRKTGHAGETGRCGKKTEFNPEVAGSRDPMKDGERGWNVGLQDLEEGETGPRDKA